MIMLVFAGKNRPPPRPYTASIRAKVARGVVVESWLRANIAPICNRSPMVAIRCAPNRSARMPPNGPMIATAAAYGTMR